MTVYFIGAGPGDPELITVKGQRLVRTCPVILYAGSLVPAAVLDGHRAEQVVNTAELDLDAIVALLAGAHAKGQDVARVHSGDPSLYGAIGEQIRRLKALVLLGIDAGSGGPHRLPAWPAVWPALAIGVLQFTLAFLFYFRGARDNASYWSVVVLNLIPVVGIAASILILGESASPIYFVGGAITIGAALYTHLRERRTELAPARA